MNEENLVTYYNKFNEEKRLKTRHGLVEYTITMKYIKKYLNRYTNPSILDIGAGMGAYSIPLADDGYDVTSVELVKHNLMEIKKKNPNIKAYQGNAIDLSRFDDNSFDIVLLFGPMYHLISKEEKLKALSEAKRVVKENGTIFVAYIMNEYAVLTYAFKEKNILSIKNKLSNDYKIISNPDDLYAYMRTEEIDELNKEVGLSRELIITPDGPVNYTRPFNNDLSDEEFKYLLEYVESICERQDILGASAHTVDILKK